MRKLLPLVVVLALLPFAARAQMDSDFSIGGAVRIGASTTTCNASAEGGIRYTSTGGGCIQFCNGTSWQCMSANSCDNAPAYFDFTDQNSLGTSTQVLSNIAPVTGMDAACAATVSVSGQGTPEYRICSTSNCSSVDITWTTSNNSVAMQGKYIQLRANTNGSAGTTHTITAGIGPVTSNWAITTTPTDCSTGAIGTICADGTVYAGTSPDGSWPIYVTRCDYNQSWDGSACINTRAAIAWNNGQLDWVDTSLANCSSVPTCDAAGEANTTFLAATDSDSNDGGVQPHAAAKYCDDLTVHGNSDWYLPSAPELDVIYGNKTAIGQFEITGSGYWSSSEKDYAYPWYLRFSDGYQGDVVSKEGGGFVRCARRDADVTPASLSFTDQTGLTAAALTTSNIVQITGIDATTRVYLDGAVGNPQFQVCADSSCSTVLSSWSNGPRNIGNNQYLQLRMYANGAASSLHSVTVFAGTLSNQWDLTTAAGNPCTGSPLPGAVCTNGTVYAGVSPDGSVAMYVTRCDYNQTWSGSACINSRQGIAWNNGQDDWVDTSLVNCGSASACDNSGETNTTALAAEDSDSDDGGVQPHAAAKYCNDLTVHGNSDWYLPSAPELDVIYGNKAAIGQFDISGSGYWSSSEDLAYYAWFQRFSDGYQGDYDKNGGHLARCARR